MNKEPIYLSMSPEIEELINNHQIDFAEVLRDQGLDVSVEHGKLPGSDSQTREVTLIIMASAAAFLAVSAGVAHVINSLANKGKFVEEETIEPVVSPAGEVLRDEKDRPILQRIKKYRYLPSEAKAQESDFGAEIGADGISFKLSTKTEK